MLPFRTVEEVQGYCRQNAKDIIAVSLNIHFSRSRHLQEAQYLDWFRPEEDIHLL